MSRKQRNLFIPHTVAIWHARMRTIGARLGNVRSAKGLGCVPQMEPTMISLKVLSTAAALALVLPMAASTPSFAQSNAQIGNIRAGGGGAPAAAGGAGVRAGGSGGGGGVHVG